MFVGLFVDEIEAGKQYAGEGDEVYNFGDENLRSVPFIVHDLYAH